MSAVSGWRLVGTEEAILDNGGHVELSTPSEPLRPRHDDMTTPEGVKVASLLRRSLARFRVVPVALAVACGALQ